MKLSAQPWWTAADRAELELLAAEWSATVDAHEARCPVCKDGGPWCQPVGDALDDIVSWRNLRVLRRRATWLREREREPGRVRLVFDERGEIVDYQLAIAKPAA